MARGYGVFVPPPPPPPAGPVTLDDVRAALGDTDPSQTNAGKLRAAVGRGSVSTVQRHLDTIRAERAAAALEPLTAGTVPEPPADVIARLWTAAYSAAETLLRRRLDAVTAERDALMQAGDAQRADADALASAVDAAEAQAVEAAAAAAAAQQAAGVAEQRAQALEQALQAAEQRTQAVQVEAEHAAQLAAAQHAAELQRVEHDRQVERATLQAASIEPESGPQKHSACCATCALSPRSRKADSRARTGPRRPDRPHRATSGAWSRCEGAPGPFFVFVLGGWRAKPPVSRTRRSSSARLISAVSVPEAQQCLPMLVSQDCVDPVCPRQRRSAGSTHCTGTGGAYQTKVLNTCLA